jgi:DNA-binding NarL/FixJ family response regulator
MTTGQACSQGERVSVALAASHRRVRSALLQLMTSDAGLAVVEVADDDRGAARCVLQRHPQVMVIALPAVLRDGGALLRRLRALAPATALVIVTTAATAQHRAAATAAGAVALVPLDAAAEDRDGLVGAIHGAAHS